MNTLCLVNCATASNGYDEFCYCNICSENEGDCDAHDECKDGLACGSNNCPASLGFDSEVDCCYPNDNPIYDTCWMLSMKGNGYCDDGNNNECCGWDGGDCCGSNVNTNYCSACECLDPNPDVSCGGHYATSCEDCPSGNGAFWCNGDCEWNSSLNKCQMKGKKYFKISC